MKMNAERPRVLLVAFVELSDVIKTQSKAHSKSGVTLYYMTNI